MMQLELFATECNHEMGTVDLVCSPQRYGLFRQLPGGLQQFVKPTEPVCVRYGSCRICGDDMQDDVPADST
jgi:hypothetical protein